MFLLSIIDDVFQWISYGWWIILFLMAWWWYSWAKEHLSFSPVLTLVVGAILVYYLVIEHPFFGAIGVVGWILISSGILYLLPMVGSVFRIFHK